MKRFTGIASALVLLAVPMFASSKKPQTIVIPENVQVGTTKLPAGTYKLEWTGTGQQVQATITTKDGKTVATFAAKAIEAKNGNSGVDIDTQGGVSNLKRIILENVDLQIEPPTQSGQ